ncbi:MAG TPA: hypothetical protein PKM44_13885 [Turneriella sp.]|nr:hypothetical protein [Turneriella sp.]
MRQKSVHTIVFFSMIGFLLLGGASPVRQAPLWAQDSESFFDDELPEEKPKSGDLKSKPIEIREDDEAERKKALKKTNEKGEVVLPKVEKPKDDGPIEQVAPLSARPKETILDNSRFSIAGDYFLNTGRGTATLPTGWGAFLAYDADESNGKGFDLRFEAGYLNITKAPSSIEGFYGEAGFAWLYRIPKMPLQLVTSILPGLGYYNFKDANAQGNALKFTAHAALGIEFPFMMKKTDRTDEIIPFLQLRGGVIYDNVLPIVHYGVYAGFAYKFGQVVFKY